jgi:hypothetical protein
MIKVASHCEHDVVGAIVTSLKEYHLDERLHALIHIVVKQTLIILEAGGKAGRGERERKEV